jgi:hypothetical protein
MRPQTIFQRLRSSNASSKIEEEQREERRAEGVKDKRTEQERMEDLINAGNKTLFKLKAIFPFDLFPDELIIDPLKISHVHKIFFYTDEMKTFLIDNIKNITIENFLIFSKIIIYDDTYINTGVVVGPFLKKDAVKAYNIIQGLMASVKREIDPTQIEAEKDIDKLINLGLAVS